MSAEKLKVGVLGVGKMGALHLEKYARNPDVCCVGFYEPNRERASVVAQKFRLPQFTNINELLFETDAISIASPTAFHYSLAKAAFEAGVHVLMEKPICASLQEGEDLVARAEQQGLVFQVGFLERYRLRSLCQQLPPLKGRFYDFYRESTLAGRDPDLDVVTDLMIHDLDLILSLTQEEPTRILALGLSINSKQCDLAKVTLEFPSGILATLYANRASSAVRRVMHAFSDAEHFTFDFMLNKSMISSVGPNGGRHQKELELSTLDSLGDQCADFVRKIISKQPPWVSGLDGLKALKLAQAISGHIKQRTENFPRSAHGTFATENMYDA